MSDASDEASSASETIPFARIPHALLLDVGVPDAVLRTFGALSIRANGKTNECFPKVATLATMTGQGESTVRRHLTLLEERGYIERVFRFRENGSQRSTLYRLRL